MKKTFGKSLRAAKDPKIEAVQPSSSTQLWMDEDDAAADTLPEFKKQSHKTPLWAQVDSSNQRPGHSAEANQMLENILSSTAPVVLTGFPPVTPKFLNTFKIKRDNARCLDWHQNSQIAAVCGSRTIYVFHSSGKVNSPIASFSIDVDSCRAALPTTHPLDKLQFVTLEKKTPTDDVVILQQNSPFPILLNLSAESWTPMKYCDVRTGTPFTTQMEQPRHPAAPKKGQMKRSTFCGNPTISKVIVEDGKVSFSFAQSIHIAALQSAAVIAKFSLPEASVTDFVWTTPTDIAVLGRNQLYFYDVRRLSQPFFHQSMVDEGSVRSTCLAYGNRHLGAKVGFPFAIGSESGAVNLYLSSQLVQTTRAGSGRAEGPSSAGKGRRTERNDRTLFPSTSTDVSSPLPSESLIPDVDQWGAKSVKPMKTFLNLKTPISTLDFGVSSTGVPLLAICTSHQKGGFRLATLPPHTRVIPSFPATNSRHDFPQFVKFAPKLPVLSVGEAGIVTNYAL